MVFHEKKDRKERDNYKGVSLIAHAGKILLKALTCRLSGYCERVGNLPGKKSGFRLNRFTTDIMSVLRWLQELARNKKIEDMLCLPYQSARLGLSNPTPWTVFARFDE